MPLGLHDVVQKERGGRLPVRPCDSCEFKIAGGLAIEGDCKRSKCGSAVGNVEPRAGFRKIRGWSRFRKDDGHPFTQHISDELVAIDTGATDGGEKLPRDGFPGISGEGIDFKILRTRSGDFIEG